MKRVTSQNIFQAWLERIDPRERAEVHKRAVAKEPEIKKHDVEKAFADLCMEVVAGVALPANPKRYKRAV